MLQNFWSWPYDAGNRLTGLAYTWDAGAHAIDSFGWSYDAANNVTGFTSDAGTATYSYDSTNQVTGASYTGTNQPVNESYSYDSNGNRTNAGYTTGTNNQLTSDGTCNYAYDAEGNRITRTRISNSPANDYKTTYTWDYRDRLTDVEFYNNSGTLTRHVHYVYEAFDHLITTEVDTTGSGSYNVVEHYVLDVSPQAPQAGMPGTALAQPVLQFDGSGNLTYRYLEAVDRIFAEGAVSSPSLPDTVTWMLDDNLGSVRYVLDNNSNIIDQINYNSFGQIAYESNSAIHHFAGYAGGHIDQNTGLVNDYHRWYDPVVGRWISPDPSGFAARDPNLSRYAENKPTNSSDNTGLSPTMQYSDPVTQMERHIEFPLWEAMQRAARRAEAGFEARMHALEQRMAANQQARQQARRRRWPRLMAEWDALVSQYRQTQREREAAARRAEREEMRRWAQNLAAEMGFDIGPDGVHPEDGVGDDLPPLPGQ